MKKKLIVSILVILVLGMSFLALLTMAIQGKVVLGVKVAGVMVGGKIPTAVENVLTREIPEKHNFIFSFRNREWQLTTANWDLRVDYQKTMEKAMQVGREGNWLTNWWQRYQVWRNGFWVEPVYTLDEAKQKTEIETMLAEIEIPAMEPQIVLENNGNIAVSRGQNGVQVDRNLLMARINNDLFAKNEVKIIIPAEEVKPAISEIQVEKARDRALKMVGKKIEVINTTNKQKWVVTDKEILYWMKPGEDGYRNEQITLWLNELAPSVNKPAQNASFTIVGNNKLEDFKPEVWGVALNTPGSYEKITEALNKLENGDKTATAELVLVKIAPEVTLDEVSNLGLKERLGKGESWFSGSITNRIYNLKKASSELNGVIVPPGETFSFNKTVGEVSSDTGYKQAYVIKEGKTVLGDGGGVCQVSSTLFRAVLAAGLPVLERTAHAYRVHYYEEKYQVGFDATVFQPSPDFKFRNDTPAYLLIQTVYDEKAKYLAFEIYGTTDGRIVELSKSRMWDQTPPPPDLYIDDPNLPMGQVIQTEHAAWGAKAAFDYKVTREGEVLQDRTFVSVYKPWQAVFQRGTRI